MRGLNLGLSMAAPAPRPTPLTILPDVCYWARGDNVTLNGATASAWPDKSGKGNVFAQATGAKQPTWNEADSDFNGLPSLTFNGTSNFFQCNAFTKGTGNAFFIWCVAKLQSVANYNMVWSEDGATGEEFRFDVTTGYPDMLTGYTLNFIANPISCLNVTKAVYGFDLGAGGAHGLGVSVSNGATVTSSSTAHTTIDPTPITLGSRNSGFYFGGKMADIVVSSTMPGAQQLAALQAYGQRYGNV